MTKDAFVKLAKKTIGTYVKTGKIISLPKNLPQKFLKKRAGVFVSIHKKDGALRGCIGTFLPIQKNLAEEIIRNAITAATQDPRFPPINPKEISDLMISVDVLSCPKLVTNNFPLDPKKYGLIVSSKDGRRGLLLPNIPGVNSPNEQVKICKQKAGIRPDEEISRQIFTVERHEE